MKIAIDLTSTPKNKTGIGRYLYNLVYALQSVDEGNEYYLFIQDDDLDGFNLFAENFNVIPVKSKILRKTYLRIIWEQLVFPFRLKKLKVDLLHSPYYTMPYFLRRIKKVVTFHDMSYFILPEVHTGLKRELFKGYIRLSAKFADRLICISECTAKDTIHFSNPKNKDISVTPLGADKRFYSKTDMDDEIVKKYKVEGKYLLYVGTVEPRKNILGVLKAYTLLPDDLKEEYKVVIAGKKGWLYDDIYKFISDNKLEEAVHFTGFVSDEDLPSLYRNARLFIYVSKYEGFGIPVMEAMACGTPVITSNTSSLIEIAENAALTVNPEDNQEISNAMVKLLSDDTLRDSLIVKGRERAMHYNWENCARKTVEAYTKALGNC